MKKNTFLTLLTLFIVTSFFAQGPETYFVKVGGDNTDGLTEAKAFTSISSANDNAAVQDGDIIKIVGSISQVGPTGTSLTKSLKFEGKDNGTIIGNNSGNRLFGIGTPDVVVSFSDITFKDNIAATAAGGVFQVSITNTAAFTDDNLTLNNCNFESNETGANGGAIFVNAGKINVSGSTFYKNKGANGGAMFLIGANTVANITNCSFFQNTIVNNNGAFGAAIRAENNAVVTVTNSLGWDNTSGNGAISGFNANAAAVTTAINSLFSFANNIDTNTGSKLAVNLTNSSVIWNATLKRVTYTAANHVVNDATPIDFGTDLEDVGAWDSKINIFKGDVTGAVEAWDNIANWTNGTLPTATDNVAILNRPVTLNIDAEILNLKVVTTLKIKDGESLIVNGDYDDNSGSGTVSYRPKLDDVDALDSGWYLVASPVSGLTFNESFVTTYDILVGTEDRAIASYTTSDNTWSFLSSTGSIPATSGKGFSMKLNTDPELASGIVFFNGAINTSDVNGVAVSTLGDGFNLLGNPYTSYMSSATFLGDNTNLNQSQIWTWNYIDDAYTAQIAEDDFVLAPGQGFFVQANSPGTTVDFAKTNQANVGAPFQRAGTRTEVKLLMSDGTSNRFAKVYYTDSATTGYDVGWEGATFGGIKNSLDVFTHLVADSQGKNYQIQSLPVSELESLEVAVGLTVPAGKEITFSAETLNLPTGVELYLEDRELNIFTQLDEAGTMYKVTLANAIDGIGRFFIHGSSSALSTNDNIISENISVYKTDTNTLRVVGLSQGKTNMKLFNVLGKELLNRTFNFNGTENITLPKLSTGIYFVQLETEKGSFSKKIILE